MMLRVSSDVSGEEVDLKGITEGAEAETGIPFDKELLQFADSSLSDNEEAIRKARADVAEKMGNEAMVDAAGVIANFQRMVRIADGTGIPLDKPVALLSDDIRDDLGINEYGSADNTPPLSNFQKLMGKLLRPLMPLVIKRMTREMTRET